MRKKIIFLVYIMIFIVGVSSCDCYTVKKDFGCMCSKDGNYYIAPFLCSKHCGIVAKGENIDCEWYPLLFGCGATYSPMCSSLIVFGIDICSGAPADSNGYNNDVLPSSPGIEVAYDKIGAVEGVDYVITSITYSLIDDYGSSIHSFDSLEELYETRMWQLIEEEGGIFYMGNKVYSLSFTFTIDVYTDCNIIGEIELKSNGITNSFISEKSYGYFDVGTHVLEITVDQDYRNTEKYSINSLSFTGETYFFMRGENND